MEPKLLFEDSFNTFTNGLNKKEYESFNGENLKITFIEAILKPRSWWFIKLETNGSVYYLWVDKKHFERFRKLLKKDKTKKVFFQELRRILFTPLCE